jgi:hypothetical protein
VPPVIPPPDAAPLAQSRAASQLVSIAGVALLSLLTLFFLYLMVTVTFINTDSSNVDGKAVTTCIEKYKGQLGLSKVTVDELYQLNGFCFNSVGSQLKIDQEKIRRDNYVFQRNENVVLLYMVVLITLSGVALAGLQLLASYKLASGGRGELAGGGEIVYNIQQGVSFKSSVVGLMILAMSFAFFLVFIYNVYTLIEASTPNEAKPAKQPPVLNLFPSPPAKKGDNNLLSAPPAKKGDTPPAKAPAEPIVPVVPTPAPAQ